MPAPHPKSVLVSFLVHIVKRNVVNAIPLDLLPGHPSAAEQFHGIRLVRLETLFFILIVNAVAQLQH